jgi:hypothetical protein
MEEELQPQRSMWRRSCGRAGAAAEEEVRPGHAGEIQML